MKPSSKTEDLPQHVSVLDVTCQLTFPDILAIASTPPVTFQEAVRKEYPHFQLTQDRRGYLFSSANQVRQIVLTQGALTLVTRDYTTWQTYRAQIQAVATALDQAYRPSEFVRVGLRYRRLIRPAPSKRSRVDWAALVNTAIVGPVSFPDIASEVMGSRHQLEFAIPGGSDRFRFSHGLVMVSHATQNGGPGDHAYLIDQDYFTSQSIPCLHAQPKLDTFEQEVQRVFRLCLTDDLHQAMSAKAA